MENHDCSGCSGTKFQGANLTCNRCLRPFFLECLSTKKEVTYLIAALNQYSSSSITSPTRLQTKMLNVFGTESMFDFTCPRCKKEGRFVDAVAQVKRDSKIECDKETQRKCNELETMYQSQLFALREELNKSVQLNNDYSAKLMQQQNELISCRSKYQELETINAALNQKNADLENNQNQMDGIDSEDGAGAITEFMKIMNRFDVMTHDIEARVKLECEKVITSINGEVSDPNLNLKKRKLNGANTQQQMHQSSVPFEIDLTSEGKGTVTKLKPPKKKENDSRDVYQIHVSQFDMKHTENDIEKFICENTGINASGLFKVTKLMNKKRNFSEGDEYCSFKITTIHYDVYKKITNTAIWEPEFQVRDFTASPPSDKRMNSGRLWNDRQNQQQNQQAPHKNVQPSSHTQNSEQLGTRKNMHLNGAQHKPMMRANTPPVQSSPSGRKPRNMSSQSQQSKFSNRNPPPHSSVPIVPQPIFFIPSQQMGQNFQMPASYQPQMSQIQPEQLQQQQQQTQMHQAYQQFQQQPLNQKDVPRQQ